MSVCRDGSLAKASKWAVGLALWGALSGGALAQTSHKVTFMGAASYWDVAAATYNNLPENSLGIINPENGIFSGQSKSVVPSVRQFRQIVDEQLKRNVKMLGYVPTSYFNHNCTVSSKKCQTMDRIRAQVSAYFPQMPNIAGIFFDEAAPEPKAWDCKAFPKEYGELRKIVNDYRPGAAIAFNSGTPSPCPVDAAGKGEVVVVFEDTYSAYAKRKTDIDSAVQEAKKNGVRSWVLVHTSNEAGMRQVVANSKAKAVNFVFVTDLSGEHDYDDPWKRPPAYLKAESALLK